MSNSVLASVSAVKAKYVTTVGRTVTELSEEAHRIETLIRSVDHGPADPLTSLGEAVRLANWSRQLEAYLEGIRFALRVREVSFAPREPSSMKGISHEGNQ